MQSHGVNAVSDVRSIPFSRRLPQFNRPELDVELPKVVRLVRPCARADSATQLTSARHTLERMPRSHQALRLPSMVHGELGLLHACRLPLRDWPHRDRLCMLTRSPLLPCQAVAFRSPIPCEHAGAATRLETIQKGGRWCRVLPQRDTEPHDMEQPDFAWATAPGAHPVPGSRST